MFPQTRFSWSVLFMLAAIFGSAWIVQSRTPAAAVDASYGLAEAPRVGYLAPDFTLTTVAGDELQLMQLRGKPVVLNFWASWCGPCRAEMPALQATAERYDGVASVIGVNQGESDAQVQAFADALNVAYPLLLDGDNQINRRYEVRALPTTVLIGADGVIREVIPGAVSEAVLTARLTALLQEKE